MRRHGFAPEQVLAIIARQATREARLTAADDILVNENSPHGQLAGEVQRLHERYLSQAENVSR
jgi:dephospho-CoA kinase